MRTSDRGVAALVAHEGIVPGPYRDSVGVWTYGIGHTAAAGAPDPVRLPRGMPTDVDAALRDVFDLFRRDLAKYEADVTRALAGRTVKQHEFDAAVSFHYNTGAIGRAEWVRHWIEGRPSTAADAIMQWRRPAAIIERRQAEQRLFRDGVYPDAPATVWRVSDTGRVIWTPERRLTPAQVLAYLAPRQPIPVSGISSPVTYTSKPLVALLALAAVIAAAVWMFTRG